jgi:hypothetical protein
MPNAIFELDLYARLPLWAQVLMAARLIRRALRELPAGDDADDATVRLMEAACDAATQCANAGSMSRALEKQLRDGTAYTPTARTVELWSATFYLTDAAAAAQASESFSAADAACTSSVGQVFAHVRESIGMSPLRVRILAAGDLDLLRFACGEFRVGTYDRIPDDVLLRLTPA